jgi:hypothetical protein
MGDGDPMGLIDRVEGLSDHERNALKGANAARIFNL